MNIILFYYISTCIISVVYMIAFKSLTQYQEKMNKKPFLWIPFASFLLTLISLKELYILNAVLSLVYAYVLSLMVFKQNAKRTFYYIFVIWLIGMLFDTIIMIKNNYFSIENINIYFLRSLDTIIMDMVLIGISNIKFLKKQAKELYNKIEKSNFSCFKIIYIIAIIIVLTYNLLGRILTNQMNNSFILFILLVMSLIFIYINKEYNLFSLMETKDHLIKESEFYMEQMNQYFILKHNINHQLNGLKSVANKKTLKLLDDLIEYYNENHKSVPHMKKLPTGINGIVYETIFKFDAQNFNLGIDNSIESDVFESLTARSYNLLCVALGILLDNSIQATSKTEDKIIMIDMKETEKTYHFKLINTFKDLLDIDQLGNKKYTTKLTGHGIGLFSILGRKKLKVKTAIVNDLFINEIIVDKKAN